MKTYQDIFNETLTRIRYSVEGAVKDDGPLMRAIVKAMYNFTDQLINNGIIEDRGQGQKYGKNNNTIL